MKVKLYKQKNKLSCGPAVLKMIFSYYGFNISESEIIKGMGGLRQYGVRAINLAEYAHSMGFKVKYFSFNKKLSKGAAIIKKPSLDEVHKLLKRKIPVILAVNSSILYNNLKRRNKGHFIIITKYRKATYWYNDPRDGKQHLIKHDDLLFTWYNNVLYSSAYLLAINK